MRYIWLRLCFILITLQLLSAAGFAEYNNPLVAIERDNRGVWFIKGDDDAPLYEVFKAMGYAVATDRLWQLELYRRTATGRLAEVFGTRNNGGFVESDIFMRTIGYSEDELDQIFANMSQEIQDIVQGYVDGINLRIFELDANPQLLPYEFAVLGLAPGTWTVNEVLAWTAALQRNFDPEALDLGQLENADLLMRLAANFGETTGFAMFNDLRWSNDPAAPTVIPGKLPYRAHLKKELKKHTLKADPTIAAKRMKRRHRKIMSSWEQVNARVKMGSYAWVLSGKKTESGNPTIYSGPQMGFSVPSIVLEGSIRAGGLNISGMSVPGLPAILIGRTPHHGWSMQVGHAHTTDYYFEQPASLSLHRLETIRVFGEEDIVLPVYRSGHGPVVNPLPYVPDLYDPATQGPIVSWKYSHWNYEFASIEGLLKLARATSMDQFEAGVLDLGVSMHLCYADREGNIAYWMSGRNPVRPEGEWRLPQGTLSGVYQEWDEAVVRPLATDRNTPRGWYGGWNNKADTDYDTGFNGDFTLYGPFHRTHVLYDYLARHLKKKNKLSFEEIRELELFIVSTDSLHGAGNPWTFVSKDFRHAVNTIGRTRARNAALKMLRKWDGHFVAGGMEQWATGQDRAEAWVLMDHWTREVLRLTFFDELAVPDGEGNMAIEESDHVLFNALLHGLHYPGSLQNGYNWFQNTNDASAPQDADTIIVAALDNILESWESLPQETFERGYITYNHDILGPIWQTPYSFRSTYAHCVEYGENGPTRIESMFPLGESGQLWVNPDDPATPLPDVHFFSMTSFFDNFVLREFPVFQED